MNNRLGLMDKGHIVLATGFVAILLLMGLLTNYAMDRVEELNRQLQTVVENHNRKAALLKTMHQAARERLFTMQHMLLIDDIFKQDEDALLIDQYGGQFIGARDQYTNLPLSRHEQQLLDRLSSKTQESAQILRNAINNIYSSDINAARELLLEEAIPAQLRLVSILSQLDELQEQASQQTEVEAQRQQAAARHNFLLMGGVALLLGLFIFFFSLFLSRRLTHQAHHDPLTGICNRRGFECRLRQLMHRPERIHEGYLCLMDLDHFKQVNDCAGHAAGDALLKDLVCKIGNTIRRGDIFARLGGDEFALVLDSCPEKNARRIAIAIRDTVREHLFRWEGSEYRVGISIGMVAMGDEEQSAADLLAMADDACYSAKEGGRNQIHIYHEDEQGARFIQLDEGLTSEA